MTHSKQRGSLSGHHRNGQRYRSSRPATGAPVCSDRAAGRSNVVAVRSMTHPSARTSAHYQIQRAAGPEVGRKDHATGEARLSSYVLRPSRVVPDSIEGRVASCQGRPSRHAGVSVPARRFAPGSGRFKHRCPCSLSPPPRGSGRSASTPIVARSCRPALGRGVRLGGLDRPRLKTLQGFRRTALLQGPLGEGQRSRRSSVLEPASAATWR